MVKHLVALGAGTLLGAAAVSLVASGPNQIREPDPKVVDGRRNEPNADEVDERLELLAKRVAQLEREKRASKMQAETRPGEETTVEEPEDVRDARTLQHTDSYTTVDVALDIEEPDLDWTGQVGVELALAQLQLEGSEISEYRCGSTVCRARVTHLDAKAIDHFQMTAPVLPLFNSKMRMEVIADDGDEWASDSSTTTSVVHFWRPIE